MQWLISVDIVMNPKQYWSDLGAVGRDPHGAASL